MPLQILQKGPSFGQGLTLGIAQGLQELAVNKLDQMRRANEQAEFSKNLQKMSIPSDEANVIASLPIEQRLKLLQPYFNDPNFANRFTGTQPTSAQPVVPEAVIPEPTITAVSTKQAYNQLAGQQPQAKPQAPNAFDMGQEVRRTNLGLPETFSPESIKQLINEFQSAGYKISPQQAQQIEQQATEISSNPQKMAALQQQYDQAVKNNEMIEFRRPGYNGPATPYDQIQQAQQQPMFRRPSAKPLTEKERLEQETTSQAKIVSQNKPFMDSFRKQSENADNLYDTAKELLDLLKEGEVASGWLGGFQSGRTRFQNDATQRAEKLMEELASFKASSLAGPVTGPKINIGRATKPNLYQSPATQVYLTERILEQVEPIRIKRKIRDKLIASNDGLEPRGIESKINIIYAPLKGLQSPFELPDGTKAIDDKTGRILAIVQDGEWDPQ